MTPHNLIAAFEDVAEAPDGIARLRELVLQLAVRGQLVPQHENDEPASAVLARAKFLRAEAISRGDVPRAQSVGTLMEGVERPFALPRMWQWARLEDVALYIQRGKSPTYDDESAARVVSQKCVQWSGFDLARSRGVLEASLSDYGPERYLRAGDLLWNSTGTGTVGRVSLFPGAPSGMRVVADSHVTVIRVGAMNPEFVLAWLSSPVVQDAVAEMTTGTTKQQELNTSTIRLHAIPVPPLAEQQRIVARISELMGLINRLEAAQFSREATRTAARDSTLSSLRQADSRDEVAIAWNRFGERMDELVSDPADIVPLRQVVLELAVRGKLVRQNPSDEPAAALLRRLKEFKADNRLEGRSGRAKGVPTGTLTRSGDLPTNWARTTVGEILYVIRGASPRPKGDPLYFSKERTPYHWVKISDIRKHAKDGKLMDTDEFLTEAGMRKSVLLPRGTLVLTNSATVGVPVVIGIDGCCIHDGYLAFPKFPEHLLMREFVVFVFQTLKGHAEEQARGLAQVNLNTDLVRAFPFGLPPLAEQKRIVARVGELMATLDRLATRLDAARTTHSAFAAAAVHHLDA